MKAELFSNRAGIAAAIRGATEQLRPPPDMLPSEWCQDNVRIPAGNAIPGKLRLTNAPYQAEPMDQLVNPDCYRVTLMWGAQVGKTLLALCVQAYSIAMSPRSQMMMQPSQDDLKTWLETKFNPLAEECMAVRKCIAKPRGRDGVNNQKMKSYPGGFMMFAYSGSAKTMRGRSAPLIVCDEVDGYERTTEGHPVGLLWQRSATFGDQRFLLEISTPTIKGESYIEKAFEMGDQRHFHVECPHCHAPNKLEWENVRWDGQRDTDAENAESLPEQKPESAHYYCPDCGCQWDEGQRIAAIRGGKWVAEKPFDGHASYHLNELYSTFRKIPAIVRDYLDKLATDDLQTFTNVSLAKTWEEQGDKVDPDSLHARAKNSAPYRAEVPMGGLYLTAGIDAQQDRLECEVVAWGEGEQSWSIGYHVLWGDTLAQDVWDDLEDLLASTYQHESGAVLSISSACLDTGGTGGYTQRAYEWLKGKTGRRIFGIKGIPGWGRAIVEKPQRKQSGKSARKVDLFLVGVDEAKLIVMRRLTNSRPGPGYCNFPPDRDAEYFQQLTAEKLVTRYVKGFPVREWKKPDKARNEALDCRAYALAALKIMQPSFKRLAVKFGVTLSANDNQEATPVTKWKREKPAPEPENDNQPLPEKTQEEEREVVGKNRPTIKRSKSVTAKRPGRGWVKSW